MDESLPEPTSLSASTLALAVLGWVLENDDRAERFLSLTGLTPDALRAGLDDPSILAAPLDFLANHEPDLIRAAEALAVTPEELIAARQELSR
ncbi:DUF3572 domain-containing protein [Erythrobacter sp. F6033]|uniref:DUF3572 domain-containing protein n=1 Tax=Erythrobacter sp. F6033 TaxID=2926401 RepID=UPI001FF4ACE1|nr:DUF3572 domain-containing protein [Erythrobacter sp. F6033]MCK0127082.1 DUF3572 domain-containing protein [Erythrobacter sp. F6033]